MKRLLILILLTALLLSGCGQTAPAGSGSAVTFTDDLGRTVTVENPRRVAALTGSFAQVWLLAGGQVIAAADDAWDDLHLELPPETVDLGGLKTMSLELVLEADPDFILASANARQNLSFLDTLEAAGIPVAYFDINGFDDYLRLLGICTDITGQKDRYAQYGTAVQTRIDEILSRHGAGEGPTVLCMTASATFLKAKNSDGSVLGSMLRDLGCVNIADSDSLLLENLSVEHILSRDPDHIFIVQRGDDEAGMQAYFHDFLESHPAWGELTAVKNRNIHFMDKTLFNLKPNHRWAEAYEILEAIIGNE